MRFSKSVPRAYQAGFYLSGCKDFLAWKSDFLSGRRVGVVEVIDDFGSGTKLFCPAETTSNLERVARHCRLHRSSARANEGWFRASGE